MCFEKGKTFCKTKKLLSRIAPECHAAESMRQLEIPLKAWFVACQVSGVKISSFTGGNARGRQAIRQHSGWQLPAGTRREHCPDFAILRRKTLML
jgi:hypothetical protein